MKDTKRAERRHHVVRLRRKTKQYEVTLGISGDHGENWHPSMIDTPKRCSCSGCCTTRNNPWAKGEDALTLQERRALLNERDQLCELWDPYLYQYLLAA